MRDLIIVGGGGFAKEVIWLARECNRVVRGVLDDNFETHGEQLQGCTIVGKVDDWGKYSDCEFIVAIGSPRVRKFVVDRMSISRKPDFATLIHPSVLYSHTVKFGKGNIICAGAILTVDVVLGDHNILNLNVTVGHECAFNDFITIALSGNVTLGEKVEVGTGAIIRQGLALSAGSMLGMGGVLTKNIPENTIFAGNPARKLKEIS